jgi:pimeloyl-ACP methyl ester carboxylesterase
VIRPLADPASFGGDSADAFDVIVPSLPGFAFSTPVTDGTMNFWKIAGLWHQLMRGLLGYERYAAGGTDYGALVSGQLGHKYAEELYGIHLGHDMPLSIFQGECPWDVSGGVTVPPDAPGDLRTEILRFQQTYACHIAVHMLEPQTMAHGTNDSPVGMLAYLLQRWSQWSDQSRDFSEVFPRDHVLTNGTMWWVTEALTSSVRVYSNTSRYPWQPSHDLRPIVQAPTGLTLLAGDVYPPMVHSAQERLEAFNRSPMSDYFNLTHLSAGGRRSLRVVGEPRGHDCRNPRHLPGRYGDRRAGLVTSIRRERACPVVASGWAQSCFDARCRGTQSSLSASACSLSRG